MVWGQTSNGQWVALETVQNHPPRLHLPVEQLSNVAFAILRCAPAAFRNGEAVSLRAWRTLTGFKSLSQIRAGLLELRRWGLVDAVPYGGSRSRYVGAALLWHPQVLALAA